MYVGLSVLLLAVGAILRLAVADSVEGVDLAMVGTILIVVGIIALLVSLVQMVFMRDRGRREVV